MKSYVILTLFLCLASSAHAMMGQSAGSADPLIRSMDPLAPSSTAPNTPSPILNRFSGLLGGDFRSTGGANQLMLALGLRFYPVAHWNAGAWMPSAYEVGGSLSDVPFGFHQSTINYGGVSYQAQIQSMSEEHLAAVWQFWKSRHFIPEFMLGVSVARFHDQETEGQAPFTPVDKTEIGISQITQLGGTIPLNSHAGLNVGIGYERYSNHFLDNQNIGFDLTVSALTLRVLIEVRL